MPMRRVCWSLASIGLIAVISGTFALACSSTQDDCEKTNSCAGGTTSVSSSSSGGKPDECEPGPGRTDPIAAECGVFVSSSTGNDGNDGTPESPVQTIKAALALAGGGNK